MFRSGTSGIISSLDKGGILVIHSQSQPKGPIRNYICRIEKADDPNYSRTCLIDSQMSVHQLHHLIRILFRIPKSSKYEFFDGSYVYNETCTSYYRNAWKQLDSNRWLPNIPFIYDDPPADVAEVLRARPTRSITVKSFEIQEGQYILYKPLQEKPKVFLDKDKNIEILRARGYQSDDDLEPEYVVRLTPDPILTEEMPDIILGVPVCLDAEGHRKPDLEVAKLTPESVPRLNKGMYDKKAHWLGWINSYLMRYRILFDPSLVFQQHLETHLETSIYSKIPKSTIIDHLINPRSEFNTKDEVISWDHPPVELSVPKGKSLPDVDFDSLNREDMIKLIRMICDFSPYHRVLVHALSKKELDSSTAQNLVSHLYQAIIGSSMTAQEAECIVNRIEMNDNGFERLSLQLKRLIWYTSGPQRDRLRTSYEDEFTSLLKQSIDWTIQLDATRTHNEIRSLWYMILETLGPAGEPITEKWVSMIHRM
jgi:hypothetical protein